MSNALGSVVLFVLLAALAPAPVAAQTYAPERGALGDREAGRSVERLFREFGLTAAPPVEDEWCLYDADTQTCTMCPDADEDCTTTSTPSIGDCLTLCAPAQPAADACLYNATEGTCSAIKITPGGTTGVGASVPDGQACADHCVSNGVGN